MKKIFLSLMTLLMIFLLAGCILIKEGEEEKVERVITINVSQTELDSVYVGDEVVVPTATASDNVQGELTVEVLVQNVAGRVVTVSEGKFTANVSGTYTITYSATNNEPRTETLVVTVVAKDYNAPTFGTIEANPDQYEGTEFTIPSVTATDELDGDLTSSITYEVVDENSQDVTVSEGKFVLGVGTYTVIYSVMNSHHKYATTTTTVKGIERPAPVLTLGAYETSIEEGSTYTLPTATAIDEVEGDISTSVTYKVTDKDGQEVVVTSGTFTASVVGEYTVVISVKNNKDKEASETYQVECTKIELESNIESIGLCYVNQELTLPVVSVKGDGDRKAQLTVTKPDTNTEVVTSETYVLASAGTYVLTYTYGSADEITYNVTVKEEFVVGWDARMYTAGISGMTQTIANNYKTYVQTKLADTEYKNVSIKLIGFDQTVYLDLGTAINAANCDVIVGFTSTTFNPADAETNPCGVTKIAATYGTIAQATKRCVAQLVDSPMAKLVYEKSITEDGFKSLDVKQIVVAWFKHTASTQARIDAVEAALEAYLAGKGYEIDVVSVVIAKASGSNAYQDTHDLIVESEAVLGFNWGSNFNQTSGFLFTTARTNKTITFGSTSSRCVACMVKQNNIYVFYNELFEYICGTTMTAIYTA